MLVCYHMIVNGSFNIRSECNGLRDEYNGYFMLPNSTSSFLQGVKKSDDMPSTEFDEAVSRSPEVTAGGGKITSTQDRFNVAFWRIISPMLTLFNVVFIYSAGSMLVIFNVVPIHDSYWVPMLYSIDVLDNRQIFVTLCRCIYGNHVYYCLTDNYVYFVLVRCRRHLVSLVTV